MTGSGSLAERRVLLAAAAVGGAAALAKLAKGGPLSPPPGPVAPTAGPEPRTPLSPETTPGDASAVYRITQPGSYYLTQNLTGLASRAAIAVLADDVTIDLNGFGIIGTPTGGPLAGRTLITDGVDGLVVRNGTIRSWAGYITLNQLSRATFEDLHVVGPFAGNFEAQARHSVFRRLIIESTGEVAIAALEDCLIEDCVIVRLAGSALTLTDAVQASTNSIVQRCVVADCGNGIRVTGGTVRDCVVWGATAASSWDDAGIAVQRGLVEGCVVTNCARAGIRLLGQASAVGNQVNGCQTGIADGGFAGGRSRVDGNAVTLSSGVGIKIEKPRNVVVRNTVTQSAAADYEIAPGNAVGTILDLTAGGDLDAAAGPWANVRF